jgi:hypothetical protein
MGVDRLVVQDLGLQVEGTIESSLRKDDLGCAFFVASGGI